MKGITHFTVGVAVASCFPEAVIAGADGNALHFMLGGIFGILPDTLDFKFYRFFYSHDIRVTPDPLNPDPKMIAEAVAHATNLACETNKDVRVKLDTVRLGADLWQSYDVRFDVKKKRIGVSYGPIVDTGGSPVHGDTRRRKEAFAPLFCDIKLDYRAVATVDIFDGPLFEMNPIGKRRVIPRFIPWHRTWSHSLVTGLLFGLLSGLIFNPLAGAVVFLAFSAHALVDQLGFMGSSLFFPFSKKRMEGQKLLRSNRAISNFGAVWLSCLLIYRNLYHSSSLEVCWINSWKLLLYGFIVPVMLIYLFNNLRKKK